MSVTRHYTEAIAAAAPSEDPRHIEAHMRCEHGTLDHLSPAAFAAAARDGAELAAGDRPLAEQLAASYGL